MIRVILYRHDKQYTGFCVSGHAGFAEAGHDIVCAAVSSAVEYSSVLLEKSDSTYQPKVDENRIEILASNQLVLESFYILMKAYSRQYPGYIRVTEVRYA